MTALVQAWRAAHTMQKVVIYTAEYCPYCHLAKELLRTKGAMFEEIDVTGNTQLRSEMSARAGRSTVPQIWIGETHVGGCDDLHALDRNGKLDGLLTA
jgi:glutaredoxin 3